MASYTGYDPAKKRDGSGLVKIDLNLNGSKFNNASKIIVSEIHDLKGLDYPDQVRYVRSALGGSKLVMDSTGNEALADYLESELQVKVKKVYFSQKVKSDLINDLLFLFTSEFIKVPKNTKLWGKLKKQLMDLDPATYSHPEGGHDDLVFALALAVHGAVCDHIQGTIGLRLVKFRVI